VPFLSNPITVGICAYNEGKNIGKLLSNVLSEQELPKDSEVLVVCSGCTDDTVEVANGFAAKDARVKVYREGSRKGKASAINLILAHAEGEAILFISADTLPKKGSFPKMVARLGEPNVGIVNGNPVPVNASNSLVGRMVRLMWHFHGSVFEQLNDAGLARHATEAFCIRRGIVDRIPVETVNDDAYIAVSAKKQGWLIKFMPKAEISICGPKNYREYFQQRRRVIFGHYQLRRLTGESPQYLFQMLPMYPIRIAKLGLQIFGENDPITVATFLFTEFLVNVAAMFDSALGKTHMQWRVLPSTKTIIPQV
jgi:cellulose synthase/poly-beta-1,6-N-acetylglucosamine synthase-like glycosyltransferase